MVDLINIHCALEKSSWIFLHGLDYLFGNIECMLISVDHLEENTCIVKVNRQLCHFCRNSLNVLEGYIMNVFDISTPLKWIPFSETPFLNLKSCYLKNYSGYHCWSHRLNNPVLNNVSWIGNIST